MSRTEAWELAVAWVKKWEPSVSSTGVPTERLGDIVIEQQDAE